MPTWNKDERDLLRLTGSLQQVAYTRPVRFTEGRAAGMLGIEVKNGPLFFRVLGDKCLDIEEFSWRGVGFDFLSKPGLQGRSFYDAGPDALRGVMGGLMFTAGLENICAPCEVAGKAYPMHGRLRTTPAEHVSSDAFWDGGRYLLQVSGEMREAELFGENMKLRRRITTALGEPVVTVEDTIANESTAPSAVMLLYHINLGYPFLRPGTRLVCPSTRVQGREELSQSRAEDWARMTEPADGEPEQVFLHTLAARPDGATLAVVRNDELALGLMLEFSVRELPYFMEWKSLAAGDYVLGLEPATASVYGRAWHERENSVPMLEPFAKKNTRLTFTVLEGAEALDAACGRVEDLLRHAG